MLKYLKRLFLPVTKESFQELPFFWLLTMAMVVIYVSSLIASPKLQTPLRLVPFTLLMIIHTSLHWLSPRMVQGGRWTLWYLLVQGGLAFTLGYMVPGIAMSLGLYMALIGEAIGILRKTRWRIIVTSIFLALSAVTYLLNASWRDLIWWALGIIPMTFFVCVYVFLYTRQAEAREQAQALSRELEAANRRLTDYAERVEDLTLAAERQRMARELHDTLAQGLAGLILQLEAANSHLTSGKTERAQAIVQQAMARARATLADARHAIDNLREGKLTAANWADAVHAEVDHFTTATGLPCELDLPHIPALSEVAREQALRAVAEGLTNIAKHAQASHVWVRITSQDLAIHDADAARGAPRPRYLEIEVRDDGRGFDPAVASASGHYGLLGMRERARLAGGTLEVRSTPGAGTTLKLCLPQEYPAEADQPQPVASQPLEGGRRA